MKKLLFLTVLLCSVSFAEGPLFRHKDPIVQQEFENIYQNIRTVLSSNGSEKCIDDDLCVDVVNGWVTQENQPSFLATAPANTQNVTGDGTAHTVEYDTEVYDQGSNFNTTTYTFTAPTDGKYLLTAKVRFTLFNSTSAALTIVTSNRSYTKDIRPFISGDSQEDMEVTTIADMDANDTAHVSLTVTGGTKVLEVIDSGTGCFFSGTLLN